VIADEGVGLPLSLTRWKRIERPSRRTGPGTTTYNTSFQTIPATTDGIVHKTGAWFQPSSGAKHSATPSNTDFIMLSPSDRLAAFATYIPSLLLCTETRTANNKNINLQFPSNHVSLATALNTIRF
jgi:hypothetical protein